MSVKRRTRRRRDQKRDRKARVERRREFDGIRRVVDEMAAGGMAPGMTDRQVDELVGKATLAMSRNLARNGLATRAPWGVTYSAKALEGTVSAAFLLLRTGFEQLDAIDENTATEEQSAVVMMNLTGAMLSLAAAATLMLRSQPIPYAIAQHFQVQQERQARDLEGDEDR